MTLDVWSEAEETEAIFMERPHVVILGAGASFAAFPNGDRMGKRLPLMRNFVDVLELGGLLQNAEIPTPYEDFEAIYSSIAIDIGKTTLKQEIEDRIFRYFDSLSLPDEPTVYDHLVLSLRPKDVIATFNWDPFLCQAAKRNHAFGGVPKVLFLHGNVAFSYCPECNTGFPLQKQCPKCRRALVRPPLLYPVKQKDYQSDYAIKAHWESLDVALGNAWALTIFGYGAPKTDIEAIGLMKSAWGDIEDREMEQTEIIDIRCEDELRTCWEPFIHTHHYEVIDSFYDSYIARFPRRSGEALFTQFVEARFVESRPFPKDLSLTELWDWLRPRVEAEQKPH